MLNRSGITRTTLAGPVQILANVDLQASVGCIVPQSLVETADANGKKIAKAGTPININLQSLQAPVQAPALATEGESATDAVPMNAVLLHDVDVTSGAANGTALIFGFVNLNRVDAGVATAIGEFAEIASPLLTFVRQ